MLNRWIEHGLLDVLGNEGVGLHRVLAARAQGVLTDRYLHGIPEELPGSREQLAQRRTCSASDILAHVRALNAIAERRGQSLAQMAIAWTLRDPRVTSALIGASSVRQLEQNVAALEHLEFSAEELAEIDQHAVESGIDLWRDPATA